MATITTRAGKGAPLTNAEVDANFTGLNTEVGTKVDSAGAAAAAPVQSVAGKTGTVSLTNADVGLGNVENKSSATIRGELTSSNVTTALGYTPYNATNPSSYVDQAGARSAISATGSLAYNSTTGVVSYTQPTNVSAFTNDAGYATSSTLSSYLPLAGGTMTGAITFAAGQTFPGTGDVTLTGTQTLTNKTLTDPKLTLGGTNGIAGQALVSRGSGLSPVWGAVSSAEVKTPTNVSPSNAATNIGLAPSITGSIYYSLYGVPMAAAQWQISTVSNFTSTVVSTGDVAGTSITYNVGSGVLSTSTTYFWRVRYKDANGVYSDWSSPTAFTTEASPVPSAIGAPYGGGFYAGKIVQGGQTYYLVVAPKASGEHTNKQWKTSNTLGPNQTVTLNNGPAASAAMNSATYPAAEFCESLTIGGYTDWYLPSRDELELCYRNLKPTSGDNTPFDRYPSNYSYPEGNDQFGDIDGVNRNSDPLGLAYTPSNPAQTSVIDFKSNGTQAFAEWEYWSSSEYDLSTAWCQYFGSGNQWPFYKTDGLYVRAVRRVPV